MSHSGVCNDMVTLHLETSVTGMTTWRLWSPNSHLSLAEGPLGWGGTREKRAGVPGHGGVDQAGVSGNCKLFRDLSIGMEGPHGTGVGTP